MNTKNKKKLIKLSRIILIVLVISNIFGILFSNTYAFELTLPAGLVENGIFIGISAMFGGLPLLLLTVLKLLIVVCGFCIQVIMSAIYSGLEKSLEFVGIEDIIFAGTSLGSNFLDVNFFDLTSEGLNDSVIAFRTAIAKWYYILRLISSAVLLVMLIYVGIRMAISTIAEEQAKYKKMLVDWVTSLALLFVLHYIIIFIININNSLVNALASISKGDGITSVLGNKAALLIWGIGFEGFFMAVMYVMMVGQIAAFFLLYLKRMITIGFLIMIAPLITITYSIDKMGDGKSQALNAWFKEFSYNVLIQPFHCVIYLAFFDAIGKMIQENLVSGIIPYIFAIVIMKFMKQAEQILRKIFHFEASSMSSISESGQNFANASGKFVKWGATAGTAFATFKSAGGFKKARELNKNFKENRSATKQLKEEFKNNESLNKNMTFNEYKNSTAGQTRINEIKQTNATKEKEKAEINRRKRTEKENSNIKAKAETQLRNEMGDKGYEELKARADSGDEEAKNIISNKENSIRENSPKKKIKNASNKVIGTGKKIYSDMRAFSETESGQLLKAGWQDTRKVASAIALGGVALGMTGEFNDAVSLGQLGYGFTKARLENSTKTLVEDEADVAKKYINVTGANSQDIKKIIDSAVLDKKTGAFDKLPDAEKDLVNEISKLMGGNASKIKDIIKEFKYDVKVPNSEIDLEGYVKSLGLDNEADEKKALENIKSYASKYLLNTMASKAISQEDITKLEIDTFSARTQEKIIKNVKYKEKTEKANINVTINPDDVNVDVDSNNGRQRRNINNPNSRRRPRRNNPNTSNDSGEDDSQDS